MVAVSQTDCSPSRYYIEPGDDPNTDWLSIYGSDSLPPILKCSQSYLFTKSSSKAGKKCASTKYGDIYNTIEHDFVLTEPTGSAKTAFDSCLLSYSDDDASTVPGGGYNTTYYVPGVYWCLQEYWGMVTTSLDSRGVDFGKTKVLDVDYAGKTDVW